MQLELDKALPALQSAEEALNVLTKKDMAELKAYAKPPALVELTLSGEGGQGRGGQAGSPACRLCGDGPAVVDRPAVMNRTGRAHAQR